MTEHDHHTTTKADELSGNGRRRSGWRRLQDEEQSADLDWIGRQLGQSYDHVLAEPLPERFALLLMQIQAREQGRG